jgi:hypothetical protein
MLFYLTSLPMPVLFLYLLKDPRITSIITWILCTMVFSLVFFVGAFEGPIVFLARLPVLFATATFTLGISGIVYSAIAVLGAVFVYFPRMPMDDLAGIYRSDFGHLVGQYCMILFWEAAWCGLALVLDRYAASRIMEESGQKNLWLFVTLSAFSSPDSHASLTLSPYSSPAEQR